MEANPEILLLNPRWGESAEATIQEFTTTKPYSDLNGKILTFDADSTSRQGPRSADALKALAELIHRESDK
jgi:ABC-type hemin transport system substrate-binding protein